MGATLTAAALQQLRWVSARCIIDANTLTGYIGLE
jgi:hypothetical protein